jgi:chromosome partitioning protein
MVIVIASRKGGVGKSTILCSLAAHLSRAGDNVLLVDCDELQGSSQWAAARAENDKLPKVRAAAAKAEKALIAKIADLSTKFDQVLVDTAGHDADGNRYAYGAADLLIFPFKPSQLDLSTAEWMKDLITRYTAIKPSLRTAIVLNECLVASKRETREALAYFRHYDLEPVDITLHCRVIYRDIMAEGLGITESKDRKAAHEFKQFSNLVLRDTLSHDKHTLS